MRPENATGFESSKHALLCGASYMKFAIAECRGDCHGDTGFGEHQLCAVLRHLGPHFLLVGNRFGTSLLGASLGDPSVGFGLVRL